MIKSSNFLILYKRIITLRSFSSVIGLGLMAMTLDARAGLTKEAIEDFHQGKGYTIVRKLYSSDEIKEISDCANRLEDEAENLGSKLEGSTT